MEVLKFLSPLIDIILHQLNFWKFVVNTFPPLVQIRPMWGEKLACRYSGSGSDTFNRLSARKVFPSSSPRSSVKKVARGNETYTLYVQWNKKGDVNCAETALHIKIRTVSNGMSYQTKSLKLGRLPLPPGLHADLCGSAGKQKMWAVRWLSLGHWFLKTWVWAKWRDTWLINDLLFHSYFFARVHLTLISGGMLR